MDTKKIIRKLFEAYYDARKNKRKTISQLKFEIEYERKLFQLGKEICNMTYVIGQSICFICFKPLKREIFAADFRDRIIHHLIFNYSNQIFEKSFIYDSYSCRIGKGTHFGIERLKHFIRSCSKNYKDDCYILKLDIKGYFMSIDKNILYKKIEDKIKTEKKKLDCDVDWFLSLLYQVIFHNPVQNCVIRGKKENWKGLPKSKSLFFTKKDTGLPIGNLTSQLFGNVYLDDFDHFVKNTLKCAYYGRYVDDIVIVHKDKEYLKSIIPQISQYLKEELSLEIHPKKIYLQSFQNGVSFLGSYIKPYRVCIHRRIKGNFYQKIKQWNIGSNDKTESLGIHKQKFVASVNSYLGMMCHFNSYTLRNKILHKYLCARLRRTITMFPCHSKICVKKETTVLI